MLILSTLCNRARGIGFCRAKILFAILTLSSVTSAALIYLGYCSGAAQHAVPAHGAVVSKLRHELQGQRMTLEQSRREAEAHMDALAMHLGQLQAHIYRLDALGTRLTEMANLDKGEFDFERPPPQGGPEAALDSQSLGVPDFLRLLDELARRMEDRERQLGVLEHLLMARHLSDEVRPAGRPVRSGWISSTFGNRIHPLTGKKDYHKGIDFAGKAGSDVIAVASGVVTWSGKRSGYGQLVEINHGHYVTRYAHNRKNLVALGDKVKKGQVIARMGSTGKSTGPHVHFEIRRDGRVLNPEKFIQASR